MMRQGWGNGIPPCTSSLTSFCSLRVNQGFCAVPTHFLSPSTVRIYHSAAEHRAQSYTKFFSLGQSLLFKKKYGSVMTEEPHIAWVIPRQWWFCSSFYAFWLHVPPSLLGWEFQVPVIHYWRTHSEGQTSLLFAMFFKDSRYLSAAGSLSIGISSLLWFKSQQRDTPLFPNRENYRKRIQPPNRKYLHV